MDKNTMSPEDQRRFDADPVAYVEALDAGASKPRPESAATPPVHLGGKPMPTIQFGTPSQAAQEAARAALITGPASAPVTADARAGEPAAATKRKRATKKPETKPDAASAVIDMLEGRTPRTPPAGGGSTTFDRVGGANYDADSREVLVNLSTDFVMHAGKGGAQAFHIASGDTLGKEGFIQYATKHYGDVSVVKGGQVQTVSSGAYWWEWNDALKRVVRQVVMEPTREVEGSEDSDATVYNRFPRVWANRPIKPCAAAAPTTMHDPRIKPLYEHLLYLASGDVRVVESFICWCAHIYQNPGKRIAWSPLFCTTKRQVGKNAVLNMLRHVFILIGQCTGEQLLEGKFTEALDSVWFLFVNELPAVKNPKVLDKLKTVITELYQQAEHKGSGARHAKRFVQLAFTTNNKNAIPHISKEERFLVLGTDEERRGDEYYDAFRAWTGDAEEAGPGVQDLVNVLATMQFPAWWDYRKPPYISNYAREMDAASHDELAVQIEDMITEGRAPFDKDFGYATDIITQILGDMSLARLPVFRSLTKTSLGNAFKDLGIPESTFRVAGKSTCPRVWRSMEQWKAETPAHRAKHLEGGKPWRPFIVPTTEEGSSHVASN